VGRFVNDELEKKWKAEVVVYFKALCRFFPLGTERNHEKLDLG
jgi:hypothetical protein